MLNLHFILKSPKVETIKIDILLAAPGQLCICVAASYQSKKI